MFRQLAEALLLPPLNGIALAVLGLLLLRRRPRLGRVLLVGGLGLLWLLSTPLVATSLLRSLQAHRALEPDQMFPDAEAIVVLSAGMDREASELGGFAPGPLGLQRLRYAARLQRSTGKPLLVSGGIPGADCPPHAVTMQECLRRDFNVSVRWTEGKSGNTYENARNSAAILEAAGVHHILLVTHAWHMPRAVRVFEAFGLEVTAAPTGFRSPATELLPSLVPRWSAVRDSGLAIHEFVGRVWYELAYL